MGQEILYCWKCNIRIVGAEFDNGKAVQVGHRASCANCAPELLANLTPQERQAFLARSSKPAAPPPRAMPKSTSSASIRPQHAKPDGSKLAVAAGLGAGAVLVVVLVVLASGGGPPPEPPAPARPKATSPPAPSPRDKSAREAVARARALPEGDIDARIRAWQEVVFTSDGTAMAEEANRELRAALARRADGIEAEFRRLDEEARVPWRQEEYGKAVALLEAGKARRNEADWRLRIDRRVSEIRKSAEAELAPLLEKAGDAKRRGAEAEWKALESRVVRWGLPGLVEAWKASTSLLPTGGVYRQGADGDGLVAIEAEGFSANTAAGGREWVPVAEPSGFGGAGAMRAMPNTGGRSLKDYDRLAPRLEFRIAFVKSGRHYLWWRAYAAKDDDDSIHAGFDGAAVAGLEDLRYSANAKWVWAGKLQGGKPAYFDVDKPGVHTLQVWMREDGTTVDRLLITTNPAYAPAGVGPAESPR